MVQIVKMGKNLTRQVSCNYCSSVLSFTTFDEKSKYGEGPCGIETAFYIMCPNCGKYVYTRVYNDKYGMEDYRIPKEEEIFN